MSYDKISVDILGEDEEINTYVVSSNINEQDLLTGTAIVQSDQIIVSELFVEEAKYFW